MEDLLKKGVYFIYAPNQDKIKIGRSKNISKRFNELKTGFMDDGILIMGILSHDEVRLEHELHNRFKHLRSRGEWFIMTKELELFIINYPGNPNKVIYQNFSEIKSNLSYSTLGMYNFVVFLKRLQNKYLLPLMLALIGFIISYYNYTYQPYKDTDLFIRILSYSYFILYPILTPILCKLIIEYQSVKTGIFYFLVLLSVLILEILNVIFVFNPFYLSLIRILLFAVYFSYTKNLLLIIDKKQSVERQKRKISETLDDLDNVKRILDEMPDKKNKIYKAKLISSFVSAILTMVALIIFLVSTNMIQVQSKVILISVIVFGALSWLAISILKKFSCSKWIHNLYKFKINIIPITSSFLLFSSFLIFNSFALFYYFFNIIIIGLTPFVIVLFITSKDEEKMKLQVELINVKMEKMKTNLELMKKKK